MKSANSGMGDYAYPTTNSGFAIQTIASLFTIGNYQLFPDWTSANLTNVKNAVDACRRGAGQVAVAEPT